MSIRTYALFVASFLTFAVRRDHVQPVSNGLQSPRDQALLITRQSSEMVVKEMLGPSGQGTVDDASFYVVDISDIVHKQNVWQKELPRVRPFYAMKCNSSPLVLRTLAALGLGFDCASKAEVDAVLALGVPPQDIIYTQPIKSSSDFEHLRARGVDYMVFDNEDELLKLANRKLDPSAKLVIRIFVLNTHAALRLSDKFGAKVPEAGRLLKVAKKLGLNVVGVSFHVGTGTTTATPYSVAIRDARVVFDMAEKLSFNMTLLDIGGGYPGFLTVFPEVAKVINKALEEHFPPVRNGQMSNVRIIAEPGRYYPASAFTLVTKVIGRRRQTDDNGQKLMFYYMNDGIYGEFATLKIQVEPVDPLPVHGQNSSKVISGPFKYPTRIWGPTCSSDDILPKTYHLPLMAINEWLVFPHLGAYTIALATLFNGIPLPSATYIVKPEDFGRLRSSKYWPADIGIPIKRSWCAI